MTAHSYSVTLRGKNLKPHTDEEIIKILNRGQEKWLYENTVIYQSKEEIVITTESKWAKVLPIFKSVSRNLKDVDSVFFYCEPYWNHIRSDGFDLDMIVWARDRSERKRLWGDSRVSCMSFHPWSYSQQMAYDKYLEIQCKENNVHFYNYQERCSMEHNMDENPDEYKYPDDYDPELYECGLEYPYEYDFQSDIVDDMIKKFRGEECELSYIWTRVPEGA